jgi:hypothetical protein
MIICLIMLAIAIVIAVSSVSRAVYPVPRSVRREREREREVVDERRKKITKALVVGQYVRMFSSGCYGCEGNVVKVTPNGVDVQTIDGKQTVDGKLLHFDGSGFSYDGTFVGCGPWYIEGMK